MAPTSNVHEVHQFLGLCNFFQNHVKNFAQISAPLTALTCKDCEWKAGTLLQNALKAFKEMQTILESEPVMAYPRRNQPYALITDVSLGVSDHKKPGGLGAILMQIDEKGEHASQKLAQHEKNYTLYLLEMQDAIWAMEHFDTYLHGRHFTLFTNHRPLEKFGKIHTKTLNWLQEAMLTFDFEIVCCISFMERLNKRASITLSLDFSHGTYSHQVGFELEPYGCIISFLIYHNHWINIVALLNPNFYLMHFTLYLCLE